MDLLEIDPFWIIIGFLALAVIVFLILNKNTNDPLQDKLNKFKISLILGGVFLAAMYITMPRMGAFYYPEEVTQVDSQEEVMKYFQKYYETIDRLLDIIRWTFFIMAFWVFMTGYQFLKALGDHLKKEKAERNNESIS